MHEHDTDHDQRKRQNIALWVFMAIVLYFLVTEHGAHIVPYLPYVLLMACPLMHLFMHGGPGGHGHDGDGGHRGTGGRGSRDNHDKEGG